MTIPDATGFSKADFDLIGLTGHMGSGKDTVAALLMMRGYERIAFADQVRAEVFEAFERDVFPEAPRAIADAFAVSAIEHVSAKPTPVPMRKILQWWGTEYRRSQDQDYWVRRLASRIKPIRRYVISDVRFGNEVDLIRRLGGEIWKIERDVRLEGIPGHASEACVDQIMPDTVVRNTGDLASLAVAVRNLCYSRQCPVLDEERRLNAA